MTPILELCRELPECRFGTGETVLEEGQKSGVLYFMISGEVLVLKQGIKISRISEPGAVFGELSVLLDMPHMATVKALEESRFYRAANPKEFSKTHPEINVYISTLLARRLQAVTSHLVETQLQLKSKTEHVVMHRIMEALQRGLGTPAT
jgi:CRP/FNR family transcriptional regulator, cyclic AMP receptor protein